MTSPIIEVEGLSKKFIISHEGNERYTALRDVVANNIKGIFNGSSKNGKVTKEEFWALKDVNFSINQGDRVGIIGRNGAGKSTLLKILSRITEPTSGRIIIRGRVASLLEVGTGFHPELTGRENIFLNGAILGMSRSEIRRKFDEIVTFAEVEKFLDTPVKRYSSGMYVRLAFAVAAHLEPEILVIDEVLAVGDAQFQKKCLGKMEDVSKNEGKTLLFVSHNTVVISQLCNKTLLLANGINIGFDSTDLIIDKYLHDSRQKNIFLEQEKDIYFTDFKCYSENGESIKPGSKSIFEFEIFCRAKNKKVHIAFGINDKFGNRLSTPFSKYDNEFINLEMGNNKVICEIENFNLIAGTYYLHLYVGDGIQRFDYISEGISMEVVPGPFHDIFMPDETHGYLLSKQKWLIK